MSAVLAEPFAEGEGPPVEEDVPPWRDLMSLSILRACRQVSKPEISQHVSRVYSNWATEGKKLYSYKQGKIRLQSN